jgi:hypothetical protein
VSDCSQIGTGSSNSLRSATESRILKNLRKNAGNARVYRGLTFGGLSYLAQNRLSVFGVTIQKKEGWRHCCHFFAKIAHNAGQKITL